MGQAGHRRPRSWAPRTGWVDVAVQVILISAIRVPSGRLRQVDEATVRRLAASMREHGLLQPITVRPVGRDFELVAGAHRLSAGSSIGLIDISANVLALDDLQARMAEIDENLVRSDLTVLERAEHLAERKRVYLLQHPETKQGGAPGVAGGGKAKDATVASFATDTSASTGIAVRTIQQHIQIAESLPEDVRMRVRKTPLATSTRRLTALAGLTPDDQRAVVTATDLTDGAAVKVAIDARSPQGSRDSRGRSTRRLRAVVPSRPEPVVRVVYTLGVLHRFLELDLSEVVGQLTPAEVASYHSIADRLRQQFRSLDDLLGKVSRAI